MENSITLFGASGHGKVIIDILQSNSFPIELVVDDNPKTETLLGIPVLKVSDFDFTRIQNMIISIGNNKIRKAISEKYKVNYINAIHSTVILSKNSELGVGTVIMAGAIVNPNVIIGNHCIINTGAIIEHDCSVSDYAHISPGVSLAGNVTIGEGAHVGIGACVLPGVRIGKWATIGAGTVVLKDVPNYAIVAGNPATILKYNTKDEF